MADPVDCGPNWGVNRLRFEVDVGWVSSSLGKFSPKSEIIRTTSGMDLKGPRPGRVENGRTRSEGDVDTGFEIGPIGLDAWSPTFREEKQLVSDDTVDSSGHR